MAWLVGPFVHRSGFLGAETASYQAVLAVTQWNIANFADERDALRQVEIDEAACTSARSRALSLG